MKVIMKCVNIKLWDILGCFHYILNAPRRYNAFKSEVLKDNHCETAQFWARYFDIIQMVLTLMRATKKTTLNCMSALSVCLVPNVFANDHSHYAHYVPVYLITLINLFDTHCRCKELLEQ